MTSSPAALAALVNAARAAIEADYHDGVCSRKQHFEPLSRVRFGKRHAALHAELSASAPPCDCYLSKLVAAVNAVAGK